jgi:hypothetical protein
MQVRPEVNPIVGACIYKVNAVTLLQSSNECENGASKKPISTSFLVSNICIGREPSLTSCLINPSLDIASMISQNPRSPPMAEVNVNERKGPGRVTIPPDEKILVGRAEAAGMLSISCRALDYLVANKQLLIRRIGTRVLIPVAELRRFSRSDHPERLVG